MATTTITSCDGCSVVISRSADRYATPSSGCGYINIDSSIAHGNVVLCNSCLSDWITKFEEAFPEVIRRHQTQPGRGLRAATLATRDWRGSYGVGVDDTLVATRNVAENAARVAATAQAMQEAGQL